jgi:hypothetical protein
MNEMLVGGLTWGGGGDGEVVFASGGPGGSGGEAYDAVQAAIYASGCDKNVHLIAVRGEGFNFDAHYRNGPWGPGGPGWSGVDLDDYDALYAVKAALPRLGEPMNSRVHWEEPLVHVLRRTTAEAESGQADDDADDEGVKGEIRLRGERGAFNGWRSSGREGPLYNIWWMNQRGGWARTTFDWGPSLRYSKEHGYGEKP